jgi:lipoprotein-anchoring transpeptidase ErfK/SrfK
VFFVLRQGVDAPSLVGSSEPSPVVPEPILPVVEPEPVKEMAYHSITLGTEKHGGQLIAAVGQSNLAAVLSLNRIDIRHLQDNQVIIVPDSFEDPFALSSFPKTIPELATVSKMLFVAQREQEFGAYEYGVLVRFGGISTGKKATPTTSKLFYANWKGKEVVSTSNDEWILKWNVNIANKDGIGIHEYELPGYPASHSCIRFSAEDAEWFYNWVDNWILSPEEQLLAQGTPVLVFGEYAYGKAAPWKKLVGDPKATTITLESLQERINPLLEDIRKKQEERIGVTSEQ